MERKKLNDIDCIVGYHTQEYRESSQQLDNPIKCRGKNAWLGTGYYFWTEEDFAHYWGTDFKHDTGFYDVYKALINCENCINAVFDEKGYFFFKEKILEAIKHFKNKNVPVTLEIVNRFLADNIWPKLGVEGIIYDDKPHNPSKSDRVYSEIPDLYYRKRIQIMVFNLNNIYNFELYLEEQTC